MGRKKKEIIDPKVLRAHLEVIMGAGVNAEGQPYLMDEGEIL